VQLENLIEGTSVSELRKFPDERAHVKSKVEGLLSQFDWGTIDDDAEAE
jgi:hypothetical protein